MENQLISPTNRLLRVSEVAEILAVSASYVYLLIQRSEIPVVMLGSAKRLRPEDVETYIDGNTRVNAIQHIDYNGN